MRATRGFDLLAERYRESNVAVALDESTDTVRVPLSDVEQQGYHLEFWPSRFQLRTAVDAMILRNHTTPITVLRGH